METNNLTAPIAVEKDRNTLTIELMNCMKLHGMAAAFTESLTSTMAETMTIDSFLHMLLAREWDYRANAAIQRLIRGRRSGYKACLEQIDYAIPRALTAIRWSGLHRWSSSARDRTSSSQGHPVPGRASLPQQWGMKPARRAYGHIMRMLRKLMGTLKVAKVKGTLESELKRIERSTLLILMTSSL